jgi:2,3-bisphosphoglycerate-independent phosphoglycerate mutase
MIREQFDGVLAVLPDHPTPIRVKTHTRDPVPFVVVGKGKGSCHCFSEKAVRSGSSGTMDAVDFLPFLFS